MFETIFRVYMALSTLNEDRKERDERGATMVEYAILVALISIVAVLIIAAIGPKINAAFEKVNGNMPS